MKILLDMGHCLKGSDTGAIGNGRTEQQCTREIGNKVKAKLESLEHAVIKCSCDSASSVRDSLNYRCNKANSNGGDIFISIHLNAGGGYGKMRVYTGNGVRVRSSKTTKIKNNILEHLYRGNKVRLYRL